MDRRRNLNWTFAFFGLALLLGPGFRYGPFYLYHLALVCFVSVGFLYLGVTGHVQVPVKLRSSLSLLVMFALYSSVSIIWASIVPSALQTSIILWIMVVTTSIVAIAASNDKDFILLIKLSIAVFWIQAGLGVLESLEIARWPLSPYSSWNHYFDAQGPELANLSASRLDEISRRPTGFFGNPNNYAVYLTMWVPIVFSKSGKYIKHLSVLISAYLILAANARLAFACFFVTVAMIYWREMKGSLFFKTVVFLFFGSLSILLFMITAYETGFAARFFRLIDQIPYVWQLLSGEKVEGVENSLGTRIELLRSGLDAIRHNWLFGIGIGMSRVLEGLEGSPLHNFWLELAVDLGLPVAGIITVLYVRLLMKLRLASKRAVSLEVRRLAWPVGVALTVFIISNIALSSALYMLPFWLMLGLALAISARVSFAVHSPTSQTVQI